VVVAMGVFEGLSVLDGEDVYEGLSVPDGVGVYEGLSELDGLGDGDVVNTGISVIEVVLSDLALPK
jgi:hypothetical protein